MKRIGLVVAYDGTNYCGWQTQPNGITVQGVLNETLSELLGEKRSVQAVQTQGFMPWEMWQYLTPTHAFPEKRFPMH